MSTEVTFRDFAGAVMSGNRPRAAEVLQTLLGVEASVAESATDTFAGRMKDPAFVPKAMSLRTAVTSGTDDEIRALVADCFGLADQPLDTAVTSLRARYPRP